MKKVSVIAGTPVDTQMGVDFLNRHNRHAEARDLVDPLYRPVAEDCDAQIKFQYSDYDGKRGVMDAIFDADIADGVNDFFIYCNSLSGAFDFDSYAVIKSIETGEDIRIYTPLQIYRKLGRGYERLGLVAANNLSAHAIEEALMSSNEDLYVVGTGNMSIVRAIEDGYEPASIIEACGLMHMVRYMKDCGSEAIILGCTHFPYLQKALQENCELPLIDPADMMYEELIRDKQQLSL